MDLVALLNAPWAQPLLGLIVTLAGAIVGRRQSQKSRTSSDATDSGGQHATSHGANSPITQTLTYNTWHVPVPERRDRTKQPVRGATAAPAPDAEDDNGRMIGIAFAVLAGVCLLTWAAATYWSGISLALRAMTLAAAFVTAATWWRWPHGVRGAYPLRIAITLLGAAVMWALTVLPRPVRHEASLDAIARATRNLDFGDALVTTFNRIGMDGVIIYEVRLSAVCILIALLVRVTARALGAVIAESAARRSRPATAAIRFGNWLMGPATLDWKYFATITLVGIISIALLHPSGTGWIADHLARSPSA